MTTDTIRDQLDAAMRAQGAIEDIVGASDAGEITAAEALDGIRRALSRWDTEHQAAQGGTA